MNIRSILALGALLIPTLFLGACISPPPGPEWVEHELSTNNEALLVQIIQYSLDNRGFKVGGGLDTGRRQIETRWNEQRGPFVASRIRAIVEWKPIDEGGFTVRIRVPHEDNKSERPLDKAFDKWHHDAEMTTLATALMVSIRSRMGDYQIEINDPESPFAERDDEDR